MGKRRVHPNWVYSEDRWVTCRCGKRHFMIKHHQYRIAMQNGWVCKSCRNTGKKWSQELKEKHSLRLHQYYGTKPGWREESGDFTERQLHEKELKTWSKKIREINEWTCQYCGKKEKDRKKMHAHHIFSVSKHIELSLNINNGICLCEDCHKYEHKINGLV